MTLRQNATSEGSFSFDPANDAQAKLAIKIAGIRPKRKMSPESLSRLVAAGHKHRYVRQTMGQEGHLEALKTSDGLRLRKQVTRYI